MNKKILAKNTIFFILLAGFLLRSFYFYYNQDSQVYILWLKYFVDTGKLLSFDHPPLFFIVNAVIIKFLSILFSAGKLIYWSFLVFILIPLYKLKEYNLSSKIIISLSITYLWIVGFFLSAQEIAATTSFIFGVITIYLVYKLGHLLFNEKVGLFASLIIAFSWWHIIYSKIPLIDGFATTLICWGVYEYTRFLKKKKVKKTDLLSPTISLTLAYYSKYYSLFILPAIFFFLFSEKSKRKFIYSLPIIFSLMLFLPWVFYSKFYLAYHYALSHYFFLEFPSIFAFLVFFVKILTLPIFLLFTFSFATFIQNKKNLKINSFLLFLVFIPMAIYWKYAYLDGVSHALINLSNYMLFTLPFICLFIASQLVFVEKKYHIGMLSWLSVILIISLMFAPFTNISLEYDKNYKTVRGNLDSLTPAEINKIHTKLPTLHYVYNFKGYSINQFELVPEKTIHYRWDSISRLIIYSLEERKINITFFVKSFYGNTLIIVQYNGYKISFPATPEGNEIKISINLKKGVNAVEFESPEKECVYTGKHCISFLIEDRGYEY